MHTRQEQLQAFDRLLTVMNDLREKCPWDRKQTFDSLRQNTIEEANELSAAIIKQDMTEISKELGCAVLCKGGHSLSDANDLLFSGTSYKWFRGKRIDNPNTHGTGCTLSSAIAANLAKGQTLEEAVENAKDYISGALAAMLDLGKGSGPMDHAFALSAGGNK